MNALEDVTSYCTSEAPNSTIGLDECLNVYKSYSFEHSRTNKLLIDEYRDVVSNNVFKKEWFSKFDLDFPFFSSIYRPQIDLFLPIVDSIANFGKQRRHHQRAHRLR